MSFPVADVFEKAYNFTQADDAMASGLHPFFKPIASQSGGTVIVDGRKMVIAGSNDYLGLTQDRRVKKAARDSLKHLGTSCTGSRFLTGTLSLHEQLEQDLADFLNKEAVLTFSAGFLGSLSVISALAGRKDILYFDRDNHASLYDGARLSFAVVRKYEHNNTDQLEHLLKQDCGRSGGRLIVTDGVFSMSGHVARLPEIVELARRYGARIIVDDAHATGVLGRGGRGTAEHFGLEGDTDLITGTFSKAFASVGGFVAGPHKVINYIKHKARPFIFTAALPAMQTASVLKSLQIIRTEPDLRKKLWKNARFFKNGLDKMGFNTLGSETPVIPVLTGRLDLTLAFWKSLWNRDVFSTPAIPPGVSDDHCIIRTSVNASHTGKDLTMLLDAFETTGKDLGVI